MAEFVVQPHRTSFGTQANKLVMVLYILAIFGAVCTYGCIWGFWAVALIFYLSEKSSPYFRQMTCQLTVLLFLEAVADWLLNLGNTIGTISRVLEMTNDAFTSGLDDLSETLYFMVNGTTDLGLFGAICSTLSWAVGVFVVVVLILGAVKAKKGLGWELPLVSKPARWVDQKLHRGTATY